MAIPTSPSVVVLENDVSIYTPNLNSSVVGVVGFANKGPVDKATLITSQDNLIRLFGRPDTSLEGQGLEGALEILEATNQMYFVRGASGAAYASAQGTIGACPAVIVSGYEPGPDASSVYYRITDNAGANAVDGYVELASSTGNTTRSSIFQNLFNPEILSDQPVFSYVENDVVFLASRFAGSGTTLQLSSASPIGFSSVDINGDADSVNASSNITVSGYTASDVHANINAVYPGTGYDLGTRRDGSVKGLSVEVNNLSVRDEVVVNSDGAQAELFRNLELAPGSQYSVEYILVDHPTNNKSEYVYVEVASGSSDYDAPETFGQKGSTSAGFGGNGETGANATPRFQKLVEGTYSLAGGDSGATDRNALIGAAATKTGMYALDDDNLNISLAVIPGVNDDTIQNALGTLAESSKNFLALVAPPYAIGEVQDAVDWINGKADSRTAALNNSYVACYWPWVQVYNPFSAAEEWYDPAIFAARQCVYTDAVSEPWFAPAGYRRGRLTKPTDIEQGLNQGDKDSLYSNSINPIQNDPTTGITIFGQRTTQRTPTALDRVNVRRLMIYIRKILLALGKPFQFEPNDQFTWELVEDAINPFLDDLLARRAIVAGAVKCDSNTNTPLRVDRNELWCSVTIKPTKAAETIVFEVNLTSQSATLNG